MSLDRLEEVRASHGHEHSLDLSIKELAASKAAYVGSPGREVKRRRIDHLSKATLWTKSTSRPRSGVTAASSAVPQPSMAPIAAFSARATSLSARAAASPWSRSRSAAAGKRRNAQLTNDRRSSNKASAFVPAS